MCNVILSNNNLYSLTLNHQMENDMLKRKNAWSWPNGYGHTDAIRGLAVGDSVTLIDTDGNTLRALMHKIHGSGSYSVRKVSDGRYRVLRIGVNLPDEL